MNEATPKYITELETKLKEHIDTGFDKVDERLGKVEVRLEKVEGRLEKVENNLDIHFETIGELKVEVTRTNMLLRKKAPDSEVKDLQHRTKKLENAVFA